MNFLKTSLLLGLAAVLLTSAFVQADEKKGDDKVAVAEIGKAAPAFELKDLDGKAVKLADYKGKIVVLEWFQPSCPFCVGGYAEDGNCRKTSEKLAKDVVWLLVNSTNDSLADAKPEKNKEFFSTRKLSHTVLMDTDGRVGRAYGAKTTPHCMVIDAKGVLAYRGAIDNAQEKDAKERINYVEAAVGELKAGKPVTKGETRSYGCSVKYATTRP